MTLVQTILNLVSALNSVPTAVTAAKAALQDFETFLTTNLP
jgi:hypothetical protein